MRNVTHRSVQIGYHQVSGAQTPEDPIDPAYDMVHSGYSALGAPSFYVARGPRQGSRPWGCSSTKPKAVVHTSPAPTVAPVNPLTGLGPVSYTHLRAHETDSYLVCRLLL